MESTRTYTATEQRIVAWLGGADDPVQEAKAACIRMGNEATTKAELAKALEAMTGQEPKWTMKKEDLVLAVAEAASCLDAKVVNERASERQAAVEDAMLAKIPQPVRQQDAESFITNEAWHIANLMGDFVRITRDLTDLQAEAERVQALRDAMRKGAEIAPGLVPTAEDVDHAAERLCWRLSWIAVPSLDTRPADELARSRQWAEQATRKASDSGDSKAER